MVLCDCIQQHGPRVSRLGELHVIREQVKESTFMPQVRREGGLDFFSSYNRQFMWHWASHSISFYNVPPLCSVYDNLYLVLAASFLGEKISSYVYV